MKRKASGEGGDQQGAKKEKTMEEQLAEMKAALQEERRLREEEQRLREEERRLREEAERREQEALQQLAAQKVSPEKPPPRKRGALPFFSLPHSPHLSQSL